MVSIINIKECWHIHLTDSMWLPMIGDLKFSRLNFNDTCAYMGKKFAQNTESRKYVL